MTDGTINQRIAAQRRERRFFTGMCVANAHRPTLFGGLLIIVSHPLRFWIGNANAWLDFATWLTGWARSTKLKEHEPY